MPRKDNKIYRVRNHRHEVTGPFSKKEILRQIASEAVGPQDEISTTPFSEWHKVAGHPDFYDAFLKKITDGTYEAPPDTNPSNNVVAKDGSKVNATRRLDESSHFPDDPAGNSEPAEDGHTIHQSDIDALFRSQEFSPENENPLGQDLIALEPKIEGPTPELGVPLAEPVARKPRLNLSPRARLWAGVAVVLGLLFVFGSEDAPKEDTVASKPSSKDIFERTVEPSGIEAQFQALVAEADGLRNLDLTPAYPLAVEIYREALSLKESDPSLIGKLAETQARHLLITGKNEKQAKELTNLIERGRTDDPQAAVFYRVEALLALGADDMEVAAQKAEAALKANPLDPESYVLLGEIALANNEIRGARAFFEDAARSGLNSVRGNLLRGKVAFLDKDFPAAKASALDALKLNAFHPPTYLLLADVAVVDQQVKEARGYYETSSRLSNLGEKRVAAEAFLHSGELYELTGQIEEAQKHYRLAYFYDDKLPGVKEKTKGLDLDRQELKKLAKELAYGPEYFLAQADAFLQKNKPKDSAKFVMAAYLCEPRDPELLVRLGQSIERVAASSQDLKRASNLYQRAIEQNADGAVAFVKLGLLETDQYNFERGYKLLRQAEALSPEEPETLLALLKHFYKRQDYAQAVKYLQKARQIAPQNSEINFYAGKLRLLIKKDAIKDALPFFQQAYLQDPQNYEALKEWLRLRVLEMEKNFALKYVHTLLEGDKQNPKLYWVLGEVYAAANEPRRAIPFYHQSLDLDNRAAPVRMSLAESYEAIGDVNQAVEEYRMASLLEKRNSSGFFKASELLFNLGKYREAEETLKHLIAVTPRFPEAHRSLSKIYKATRQNTLAVQMMRKEVEMNPQNAKFRLELAELLMEYEQTQEAIDELVVITNLPSPDKAPEYVYDKIRGYLLLSRCYRIQNKFESAEGAVRLALAIDGNDPELHKELGYVYYGTQRDKESVKEFEFYLSRNPAATDAENIQSIIRHIQIEE